MKFWLLVLLGLLMGAPARADELRPGYLALTQRDAAHWEMIWKAPVLGGLATRAHPRLPAFCHASPPQARIDGAALVTLSDVTCARPLAGAEVGLEGIEVGFTDALVRIAPLGSTAQAERLTQHHTAVTVTSVPSRWEVARTYLVLGVEHILTGYDHLLFVVSLVLLLGELWVVVRAATAFTIAHSLTLAGTTLGLIGLAQAPVRWGSDSRCGSAPSRVWGCSICSATVVARLRPKSRAMKWIIRSSGAVPPEQVNRSRSTSNRRRETSSCGKFSTKLSRSSQWIVQR